MRTLLSPYLPTKVALLALLQMYTGEKQNLERLIAPSDRTLFPLPSALSLQPILRVVPRVSGRSSAFLGGDAGRRWLRRCAGVQSRCSGCRSRFVCWLYASFRLLAGRWARDPLGWIRCLLVMLLLVAVLRWSEPKATGQSSAGTFVNKALSSCKLVDGTHGMKSISSVHGDLEEKDLLPVGCAGASL